MIKKIIKISPKFFLTTLLFITKVLPVAPIRNIERYPIIFLKYCRRIDYLRLVINKKNSAIRDNLALRYIIPIINNLFEKNYVNFAQYSLLAIEEWLLSKKTDKEFEEVLILFKDHAISAGERFREIYPLTKNVKTQKKKIAFTSYWTAHSGTEVVVGLANHFKNYDVYFHALKIFQPCYEPSLEQTYFDNGITLIIPKENVNYDVFKYRDLFIKNPVDVVLWQMPPFHMFFFFAFGLAEKQVFFSQYLRPNIDIKYVDGRLTLGGSGFITKKYFNGRIWDILPQVTKINGINYFSKKEIVLFTPARLEKLKQQEFLNSVIKILNKCPDAIFKWTGYYRDKEVCEFFKKNNLETRHKYVGWLDSQSLLNEIKSSDIILACYPLSLGTVELIASFYNVPIVSMYDKECNLYWRDIHWEAMKGNKDLKKICLDKNGNSIILIAKTNKQYIETALKVINNNDLAKAYVQVYKKAYDYAYLHNKNNIQKIFTTFVDNLY